MRVLWILLMVIGCIGFGLLCLTNLYALYLLRDGPVDFAIRLPSTLIWSGLFFIASSGCAALAFMRPSEAAKEMAEPPPRRAAWLDERGKNE